jgi:hypothetical protein
VELKAGDPAPVEENDSGELEIDTENFGGAFNQEATVEIGDFEEPGTTPAFSVTNNFKEDVSVTLKLDGIDPSPDDSSSYFKLDFNSGSNFNSQVSSLSGDPTSTTNEIAKGNTLYVAIEIKTQGADSNFSGAIKISAEISGGN